MLRIPYVPTAYPDETFGSLLTRLVLYNGTGLWRSLLEETGYGRRTISPFYAMPVQDDRLDGLLRALGYSYEDMVHQLTAWPFWMAFNNASRARERISINRNAGNSTRLFLIGNEYNLSGARFCPACLTDDMNSFGEPYLHRDHQLPIALVCAKHGERLRIKCKACGINVLPFNRTLLRPPSLHCGCGEDLSGRSVVPPAQGLGLQRLSQFAKDALSCSDAPWTMHQVRTLLQEKMGYRRDVTRNAQELMEGAYGSMEKSSSGLIVSLKQRDVYDVPLKLRTTMSLFRSPEYCALLSAAGLTFNEFRIAVSAIKDTPMTHVRPSAPPFTIEQARQEFSRLALKNPRRVLSKLIHATPRYYWLLRLHDSAWVQEHVHKKLSIIPSVEHDRQKIKTVLGDNNQPLRNVRFNGWIIRAELRDNAWLQQWLKDWRRDAALREGLKKIRAASVQRNRVMVLSRALFSVLRTESKPVRIHAGLLSKVANISMHQALHSIATNPPLRLLTTAVNAGKDRRLAWWATKELINAGEQPTAKRVLLCAGLTTTKINRQLATAAIEQLVIRKL